MIINLFNYLLRNAPRISSKKHVTYIHIILINYHRSEKLKLIEGGFNMYIKP